MWSRQKEAQVPILLGMDMPEWGSEPYVITCTRSLDVGGIRCSMPSTPFDSVYACNARALELGALLPVWVG